MPACPYIFLSQHVQASGAVPESRFPRKGCGKVQVGLNSVHSYIFPKCWGICGGMQNDIARNCTLIHTTVTPIYPRTEISLFPKSCTMLWALYFTHAHRTSFATCQPSIDALCMEYVLARQHADLLLWCVVMLTNSAR